MNARTQVLNTGISAFWTAVFVAPVCLYCVDHLPLRSLDWLIIIAVVSMFLPRPVMRRLALSSDLAAYRHLRVPLLIHFTQDAAWLQRLGGSPESRARRDDKAFAHILSDTWMRERFHMGASVFYLLCAIAAWSQGQRLWCVALLLLNVPFNLYPIWLQQYLRLRVSRLLDRRNATRSARMSHAARSEEASQQKGPE